MTAPQLAPVPSPLPQTFGRYLLVERIGAGGMAEVFRAMTLGSEGFRRILVVKKIREEYTTSADFLRMFSDEAKVSALLNHPNIVQVYDFGQASGAYFLAMEHLEGRDLVTVMRRLRAQRRAMEPSLAALVAHQAAQALHYAHTLQSNDGRSFNIVHRDINPSNIMLLRTGVVKILDFGIAKASAAAGKSQTQHTVIKGKLGYLSPEQARCERLDGRSDVFSLGATLWEMLTGERIFAAKTDFERIRNVLHATISAPSDRRSGVPAPLDQIVLRAMERDLSRRYQSAEEMADDLELYLRAAPPPRNAIKNLLVDLFGDESRANTVSLPAIDDAGGVATSVERPGLSGATFGGQVRSLTTSQVSAQVSGQVSSQIKSVDGAPAAYQSGDGGVSGPIGSPSVTQPLSAPSITHFIDGDGALVTPDLRSSGGRRGLVLWLAGGIAAAALVAAFSFVLRVSAGQQSSLPALSSLDPAAPFVGVAQAAAVVSIEVDSEPGGARVRGAGGELLGTTPFTLTRSASAQVEQLQFEKEGYEPAPYALRAQSGGLVFVELHAAR